MFRNRLLEKLTQLLHQMGRIDVFQRAELGAFLSSGILAHIELGATVPLVQNRLRFGREAVGDEFHRQIDFG